MFVLAICVPSATIAYCFRLKERRLERTNLERLNYELDMRELEMTHEARVLGLPALPPQHDDETEEVKS